MPSVPELLDMNLVSGYGLDYPIFLDVEASNGRGDAIDVGMVFVVIGIDRFHILSIAVLHIDLITVFIFQFCDRISGIIFRNFDLPYSFSISTGSGNGSSPF